MTDHPTTSTHEDPVLAQAQQLLDAGKFDEVVDLMNGALGSSPSNPEYIGFLTRGMMPGPGYKHWLRRLHSELTPDSYLEIGVSKGMSMALASPETRCVGIDPAFQIQTDIAARARLYPCTSDDFFSRYDLLEELGTPRLDVAFIDGLHLFEQVLKDFINIERYASEDTVVLIHDCYPVSELTASRERQTNFWSGDVWRIIPCLMTERPDLHVSVIPSKPTGMAVITGLDPENTSLQGRFAEISSQYTALEYADFASDKQSFPLIDNDWDGVTAALKPQ